MRTLDDAWNWYTNNKKLLKIVSRLGDRYWNELPWEGRLGNDDHLRHLEGIDVKKDADSVLAEFDDVGIFVIFSVFEAIVRQHVSQDLQSEVANLQHVALKRSAGKVMQNIEEGSFYNHVLELFKVSGNEPGGQDVNHLVEDVSRVRRYRNWVAHGRRPDKKTFSLLPKDSFDILQAFLDHIGYGPPAEVMVGP